MENEFEEFRFTPVDPHNPPSILEVVNRRYEIGKKWAMACSVHHRYENGANHKLKSIMQQIKNTQAVPAGKRSGWPREELKDTAEATEEWGQYLIEWGEAYELMVSLSNEKTTLDNLFEALRTESANQRALAKL